MFIIIKINVFIVGNSLKHEFVSLWNILLNNYNIINNKYDTISDALYNDTEMPTITKCSIHRTVFFLISLYNILKLLKESVRFNHIEIIIQFRNNYSI